MSLSVRRYEYGDLHVSKPGDEGMTVAELVEALGHFPPDAIVSRFANDWKVGELRYKWPEGRVELL